MGVLVGKGAFLHGHSQVGGNFWHLSADARLPHEKVTCILWLPHTPAGSKINWENSSTETWEEVCWLAGGGCVCGSKCMSVLRCWIIVCEGVWSLSVNFG